MLTSELFDLPAEEISKIANELLEDQSDLDLIGYIMPFDEYEYEEMIKNPSFDETGSIIKSVYSELDSAREDEINNGAKISDLELEYLKKGLIEPYDDGLHGLNFMTLNINCDDGVVLAAFCGHREDIGVIGWGFFGLYESRDNLVESLKSNLDSNESYFDI